eukprot:3643500-Rhodomonas_salina.2
MSGTDLGSMLYDSWCGEKSMHGDARVWCARCGTEIGSGANRQSGGQVGEAAPHLRLCLPDIKDRSSDLVAPFFFSYGRRAVGHTQAGTDVLLRGLQPLPGTQPRTVAIMRHAPSRMPCNSQWTLLGPTAYRLRMSGTAVFWY